MMNEELIGMGCVLSAASWCETELGDRHEKMAIEREIQALKAYHLRLHTAGPPAQSRPPAHWVADWEEYGWDLEGIHQRQKEAQQIYKRIQELEERKLALLHLTTSEQ